MRFALSEKYEEILEAMWKAVEKHGGAISDIRKECVVEITDEDIKYLEKSGFITIGKTRIVLSEKGNQVAKAIVRRHRLAEVLVTSILKFKRAEMERVACEIEHSLHPEVEEAICTLLGHPEFCPDGNPIPQGRCCQTGTNKIDQSVSSLASLSVGEMGKITYIRPADHSNLEQLISFGLSPGTVVTLKQKKPVYCIQFDNTELALDKQIVENIFVWPVN